MITTPTDYLSLLYLIQDTNRQTLAITLPKDEQIYNIDLNSRSIEAPKILSVEHDHNAETVYFKVDRYYDNIDLARDDIFIVIQYENANPDTKKRGYVYAPPFIDIQTLSEENKILIPWVIEGPATAYSGTVSFAIKFYRLNFKGEYELNLNTLPSKSQVLHGMNVYETTEHYSYNLEEIDKIYAEIEKVSRTNDIYWITME